MYRRRLRDMTNVVLTPHLGSAVMEVRDLMANIVVDNIEALIDGRAPPNCVNPQVLRKSSRPDGAGNRPGGRHGGLAQARRGDRQQFRPSADVHRRGEGLLQAKHGVDAKMLVVDTGTDMVNAMHDGRAQIGDMSTTTYLKAVHAGEPFKVIGLIMNDATSDDCDDPLAIVTKKGRGIEAGKIADLKGKKIGLAHGPDLRRIFQDGAAPRQGEIRGRHHREHLVAVRPGAGAEGGQGRRRGVVGALRDAGADAGAGFVSK